MVSPVPFGADALKEVPSPTPAESFSSNSPKEPVKVPCNTNIMNNNYAETKCDEPDHVNTALIPIPVNVCSEVWSLVRSKDENTISRLVQLPYSADEILAALDECTSLATDEQDPLLRQNVFRYGLELCVNYQMVPGRHNLFRFTLRSITDVWSATRKLSVGYLGRLATEDETLQKQLFEAFHSVASTSNPINVSHLGIACQCLEESAYWKAQDGALHGMRVCLETFQSLHVERYMRDAQKTVLQALSHTQLSVRTAAQDLAESIIRIGGPRSGYATTMLQEALGAMRGSEELTPYFADGLLNLVDRICTIRSTPRIISGAEVDDNGLADQLLPLLKNTASTVRQACSEAIMADLRRHRDLKARGNASVTLLGRVSDISVDMSWQEKEGRLFVIEGIFVELNAQHPEISPSTMENLQKTLPQVLNCISRKSCGESFELQRMTRQICPEIVRVLRKYNVENVLVDLWARTEVDDWIRAELIQAYLMQAMGETPQEERRPKPILIDCAVRSEELALFHSVTGESKQTNVSLVSGLLMENLVLAMVAVHNFHRLEPLDVFHGDQRRRSQVLRDYLTSLHQETVFANPVSPQRQLLRSRSKSSGQCTVHSEEAERRRRARNRYIGFANHMAKFLPAFCGLLSCEEASWFAPFIVHWLTEAVYETSDQLYLLEALLVVAPSHPQPEELVRAVTASLSSTAIDLGALGQGLIQCALMVLPTVQPPVLAENLAKNLLHLSKTKIHDATRGSRYYNENDEDDEDDDAPGLIEDGDDEWDSWDEEDTDCGNSAGADAENLVAHWQPYLERLQELSDTTTRNEICEV